MSEIPAIDDLPPNWRDLDSIGSYYAAIEEIGRRVKAGAPIPDGGYFGRLGKPVQYMAPQP